MLAARYLLASRVHTVLTLGGVAAGVAVYIFISALIGGLQKDLVKQVIGSVSQVTLEPAEETARPLSAMGGAPGGGTTLTRAQRVVDREPKLRGWRPLVAVLDREPGVTAVSPVCSGPGFAIRGQQIQPIAIRGIDPERANRIGNLAGKMVSGRYDLSGQNCVIGTELARLLGVRLKDKVRTRSGKGRERVFSVAGIFDAGIVEVNTRSFLVSLPNAQRLLDLVGSVTAVEMKVENVFEADTVATRLAGTTGLKAESWMTQNRDFLVGLRAQNMTSTIIRLFVMVAVAFGIAAVLAVLVVQKSREIGILKSMGARTRTVMLIFIFYGLLVGSCGAMFGSILSEGLLWTFSRVPELTFHIPPARDYFLEALAVSLTASTLAALVPARRAARLDPVEVIRLG